MARFNIWSNGKVKSNCSGVFITLFFFFFCTDVDRIMSLFFLVWFWGFFLSRENNVTKYL